LFWTAFLTTSGTQRGGEVIFNLGPNDSTYISGFEPHYEIADGIAVRWTTYDATVDLPLTVAGGPVEIALRFSRVYAETAVVEVYLAEGLVDHFTCRGGRVETRRINLAAVEPSPLSIHIAADSHERKNRGLRLDWIHISVGERGSIRIHGFTRWLPALFIAFLYVLFRWCGLSRLTSTLFVVPWIGAAASGAQIDPFGFSHAVSKLFAHGVLLSTTVAAFLRTRPGGKWVVPIFVAGFLLKGLGLFHPTTFYPDVANARRYAMAFKGTTGSIAERGVETQKLTNVAYPRSVGGKDYAFPYSPLYFYPFTWLPNPGAVEDGVRHVGLASAAATVPVVFWLGSTVAGSSVGILAALLSAFQPAAYSRLILAMHATPLGHFFDILMIASVLALSLKPKSRRRLAMLAISALASLLSYVSSLFTVGTFLVSASITDRRLATKLLTVLAGSGLITVIWLYWPFTLLFFTEILPAASQELGTSGTGGAFDGLFHALSRIPIFYGYGYPALAVAGFVLVRRWSPQSFRILTAYGLAFLMLVFLRAFGGGLFKDLKEIMFVAPLVAVLTAISLEAIRRRGRPGFIAAICITIGLVVFGLGKYRDYLVTYRSPVMSLHDSSLEN
jgi:hypothetical protein